MPGCLGTSAWTLIPFTVPGAAGFKVDEPTCLFHRALYCLAVRVFVLQILKYDRVTCASTA